ncbi:MAG: ABC transporter ATP-binding protein [Saprospiraceae bacterium]|nr:ABC transporter ATP-binding protein [Saprospiraceae bacterium]MCB9319546.1 ABC transporter ATP-binding protein [Lewinellaceae bacterium]
MKNLAALNHYILRYKWKFLLGFLFVALSNYFNVLQPQMVRQALDLVVQNISLYRMQQGFVHQSELYKSIGTGLLIFGLLVILFAILMGFFMYWMRQTIIVMSRLIEYDIRKDIYLHYQTLDQAFFRRNKTGDLMARITEDVSKVRMYLGPGILYAMNLVTLFVLVVGSMVKVNLELTIYTLAPLPFLSVSIYYISNIINRKSEVIQRQLSRLNSIAQEMYSGIRVVKSYVQEKFLVKYFDQECRDYQEKSMQMVTVDALFFPIIIFFIGISSVLSIYIGGIKVNQGLITAGNIAEFVIYINMLTWPVTAIGWIASIVQQAEASQKRLNEFLDTESTIKNPEVGPHRLSGEVQFDQVSFVYPDTGVDALKKVTFRLKPGEKLAILGRTGSGKSTICDLLLRMYDVTEGSIKLDGSDLRELRLEDIRKNIAYVPQDVFLFSDTIADNISFGLDANPPEEVLDRYSEYASVREEIDSLPNRYNSMVGERGVTLSGGQKQRISIARALIKDPKIVVLDDCLSAVDTKTERQILDHLQSGLSRKTVIMVTHRVTGITNFDHILVLDKGRVVEYGNHDTLYSRQGYYFKMVEQQRLEEEQIKLQ